MVRPLRRRTLSAPRHGMSRRLFREHARKERVRGCQTTSWDSHVIASRSTKAWLGRGGFQAELAFIDCARHHEKTLPVRLNVGEGSSSRHQIRGVGGLVFTTSCVDVGSLTTTVHLLER